VSKNTKGATVSGQFGVVSSWGSAWDLAFSNDPQQRYVYVADANQVNAAQGGIADEGEVLFARSTDYGATWQSRFQIGSQQGRVVNDDNDGLTSAGTANDVASAQLLPRLVVDEKGNVAIIWYDARRDPSDHLLDVFGAFSSYGGKTFSSNFRITEQPFDADAGQFTDAIGNPNLYLGDFLGLTVANGNAYASWTDTRNGNQDIYAQHVLAFKVGGEALTSTYPAWLAFLQAMGASNRRFAQSAWYRKVLGLDQQRRMRPTSAPTQSAVDQAAQAGGGGQ